MFYKENIKHIYDPYKNPWHIQNWRTKQRNNKYQPTRPTKQSFNHPVTKEEQKYHQQQQKNKFPLHLYRVSKREKNIHLIKEVLEPLFVKFFRSLSSYSIRR